MGEERGERRRSGRGREGRERDRGREEAEGEEGERERGNISSPCRSCLAFTLQLNSILPLT